MPPCLPFFTEPFIIDVLISIYQNILVVSTSPVVTIKLADFGLAKVFGGLDQTVSGTHEWAAPEQKEQYQETYDQQVDMWSVGCVAFYLLTSLQPFSNPNPRLELDTKAIAKYTFPFWPRLTRRTFDRMSNHAYQTVVRGVSNAANRFLKNLIAYKASSRLSALQALQHEWICPTESSPLNSALKQGDMPLSLLLTKHDPRYEPHGWEYPLSAAQSQIVLRVAAASGNHELVMSALRTMPTTYAFSPEIPGWCTEPALVGAATIGNLKTVNVLLAKLPYPEKTDGILLLALQAALRGRHTEVVGRLWPLFTEGDCLWTDQLRIEISSFENTALLSEAIHDMKRHDNFTESHISAMVSSAAQHGNIGNVTLLLEILPKFLHEALLQAAGVGHTDLVCSLLRYYPALISKTKAPNAGLIIPPAALTQASLHGHFEIVKRLVERGVIPGKQAIDAAVHGNSTNSTKIFQYLVGVLIDTYSVGAIQIAGYITPGAVPHCSLDLLDWLRREQASPYFLGDLASCLRSASLLGNLEVVEWLLEAASYSLGGEGLREALVGASEGGHIEIVQLLCKKGVDLNTIDAWKAAAREGHTEVLELLLSQNSVPPKTVLESALTAAVERDCLGTTLQLLCAGAPVSGSLVSDAILAGEAIVFDLVRNFRLRDES